MLKHNFNKVSLQETADLVTFTEEVLNGMLLIFLVNVSKKGFK